MILSQVRLAYETEMYMQKILHVCKIICDKKGFDTILKFAIAKNKMVLL